MSEPGPHHVVIVGGGFAGAAGAKQLAGQDGARVTLPDRNGFHQFQPLLYQVATAELTPGDIAFDLVDLANHPLGAFSDAAHAYATKQLGHGGRIDVGPDIDTPRIHWGGERAMSRTRRKV
jgi:NAD(P)-dependent dehydrogenase (short-subunit alcohol dehydrogenase family)